MHRLTDMYRPVTSTPFLAGESYLEIAPSAALKPYVRCFWGTLCPLNPQSLSDTTDLVVIPDTCVDIIFRINYTENRISGAVCALESSSHIGQIVERDNALCATFGIRFYAWTALLFAERDFLGCMNRAFPAEEFFPRLYAQLVPYLFDCGTIYEKAEIAEKLLLSELHGRALSADFLNAVHLMLRSSGRAKISDLCLETALSERTLERLFGRTLGVSPKAFGTLLRYQLLWQELLRNPCTNTLDLVEKYGYFDQPHLLNDFRKHHLMSPKEAVEYALKKR